MALLGFMIAILDVPLRLALHSETRLDQIDRVNRALDDVAAALSVPAYQATFLSEWQTQLRQDIPGILIQYHWQSTYVMWVQIDWPLQPGESATLHHLQRAVTFG